MLIGDSGVGKTCLLVRFKDNAFLGGSFISTVGIDFRASYLNIWISVNTWNNPGAQWFSIVTFLLSANFFVQISITLSMRPLCIGGGKPKPPSPHNENKGPLYGEKGPHKEKKGSGHMVKKDLHKEKKALT